MPQTSVETTPPPSVHEKTNDKREETDNNHTDRLPQSDSEEEETQTEQGHNPEPEVTTEGKASKMNKEEEQSMARQGGRQTNKPKFSSIATTLW